ncbi:MAG: hypothetical protein ACTSRL_22855 [Candidatus Helarchaeota archaeon]
MAEIKFKITKDLPVEIIKFLVEKELTLKISRIKKIKEEIEFLQFNQEDVKIFEKARKDAWNELKRKQKL